MPMPDRNIDSIRRWIELSEIDYISPFVKAWLAFNAWYRITYTHMQDRQIIEELKWKPNPVRSSLVPLLRHDKKGEEAEQFRSFISSLHNRLESYELYTGRSEEKERITLTRVYLKPNPNTFKNETKNSINYRVEIRKTDGQRKVISTVTNRGGTSLFELTQEKYDLAGLIASDNFINKLTIYQQSYLKTIYVEANPRFIIDLTNRGELPVDTKPIQLGAYTFTCIPEELFAGVLEIIYMMRNTLFHGELIPCQDAAVCYEPAYYIIRKFLESI